MVLTRVLGFLGKVISVLEKMDADTEVSVDVGNKKVKVWISRISEGKVYTINKVFSFVEIDNIVDVDILVGSVEEVYNELKTNIYEDFRQYVEKASIQELVLMQHDLRRFKEDKEFLEIVLNEIKKRSKEA